MAADSEVSPESVTTTNASEPYVVVARRYRPQSFQELVGQNQVAQALGNAIETNRVGHAYLFTGARGVGKTSSARIFSKCLNCVTGPTLTPCDQCDICQAISAGDDVDVLEIDGASNRGIDEIRQLRNFATVRPSRSRYKIYIIDEVHMLTKEAFNALLKTLEEPPGHVKFIFCTTNPEKIPITVLSRCQRFDFAPVVSTEIKDRLKYIVQQEGAAADDDALTLLARRAGGSMRDSQSLLEQLLSFSAGRITVAGVHQMLGTAPGGRIDTLVQAMVESQPGIALNEIHQAVTEGADVSQVLEQLSGFFRDLLVISVGGSEETLLLLSPDQMDQATQWAQHLGTTRILATMQVFDWALARMRQSTHTRSLLEIAVVQASALGQLTPLANAVDTVSRIESGQLAAGGTAKPAPAPTHKTPASKSVTAESGSEPGATRAKGPVVKKNEITDDPSPNATHRWSENSPDGVVSEDRHSTDDARDFHSPGGMTTATADRDQARPPDANSQPGQALGPDRNHDSGHSDLHHPAVEPVSKRTGSQEILAAGQDHAELLVDQVPEASVPEASVPESNASGASLRSEATEGKASAAGGTLSLVANGKGGNLEEMYRAALDEVDGMVRGLALNFTRLKQLNDAHWRVSLENEYLAELCTRADRKSMIEAAIEKTSGRKIRIDFDVYTQQVASTHLTQAARQKQKSDQIKLLHSDPFVARIVEVFQAELIDILPPRPTPDRPRVGQA